MADTVVTAKFRADTSDIVTKMGALQSHMTATQAKFAMTGKAMVGTGMALTKGLTLPIVAVGTAAVLAGASFEKSMKKVKAVSGATDADFKAMSNTAKELGRTTQFSASQAADGMSFLAMAGFKANEIVTAMPGVLNLAAAGQMDLAQAADIASNVLTGFGKDASELDQAIDVMAKTFTSANTDLQQLGDAMSFVAPVANAAGMKFEEVSAAIGLLGNAGIQGGRAGTSLARIMSILTQNTQKTDQQLRALGISALDSSGNLRPLNEIVSDLEQSGATAADIFGIFGQRAGPAMAALISQGSAALSDLTGELEASGGTAQEIADIQMEGFSGAMLRLKSAFEGAMIAIAETGVLDALTNIVMAGAEALSKFTEIWGKIPGPVKSTIMVVGAFAAAIGPVLIIAGKLMGMLAKMGAAWVMLNAKVAAATRAIGVRVRTMELEIKAAMIKSRTQLGALGAAAGVVGKKVILAFRTIGVAAKGLIASFGPIGIALVGITVAFEVLMNRSAKAEQAIEDLRSTVDETTGAFTDLTAAMIAEKLTLDMDPATLHALESVGISVADMTAAILEGGDAVDEIGQKFNDAIGPTGRFMALTGDTAPLVRAERAFGGAAQQADQLRGDLVMAERATKNAGEAVARTGGLVQTAAGDFDDLSDSVDDAQSSLEELNQMFGTFDKNVAAIRARDAATEYMKNLGKSLAENSRSLEGEGKAALKNRDAVIGAFEAKRKEIETWAAATGATAEEVEAEWFKMTQAVRRQLIEEGFDARDLAKFLGEDGIGVASVRVSREMTGAIETIGKDAVTRAEAMGDTVGRQLMNGVTTGIRAQQTVANRTAAAAAQSVSDAFERQAGIRSPSRVFAEHGRNLVRGIVEGLRSEQDDLAEEAMKAFTGWFENVEQELQRQVDEIVGIYDGMASQVRSAVLSALDFSSIAPEINAEGERVGLSFTDALQQQANKATAFAERIGDLVKLGLRPAAIQEVLKAGVDAGTAIADELIDGGAEAIYVTNTLVESTIAAADKIAKETADAFYGTGVAEAKNTLRGFRKEFGKGGPSYNAMQGLMDRLARSMDRESTIRIKVIREEASEIIGNFGGPRAMGGPISAGTAYLVGEKGPELFVSDRAGKIIPNMDLAGRGVPSMGPRAGAGGGVGTVINVNISAPALTDPAEVGRQAVEAIRKYERRSGPVFVSA